MSIINPHHLAISRCSRILSNPPAMFNPTPAPASYRHVHIRHQMFPSLVFPVLVYAPSLFTSMLHSQPGSQSAFGAIGGYCVPFFSTFGSQVHHVSLGSLSMTIGTCWPQPHQEDFSVLRVSYAPERQRESYTASRAGAAFTHDVECE